MKKQMISCLKLFLICLLAINCDHSNSKMDGENEKLDTDLDSNVEDKIIPETVTEGTFFDDFNYESSSDSEFTDFGWGVRSDTYGPGISGQGGSWSPSNVSFIDYEATNRIVMLKANTEGTAASTVSSELFTTRKFGTGTYAARVYFFNAPESGLDLIGDLPVQTFFTIADPSKGEIDQYCEFDFEYLPNGGWGANPNTLYNTSWETVNDKAYDDYTQDLEGWHTLVVQIDFDSTRYYVDGELKHIHNAPYVVDGPMSVNFNLWFINIDIENKTERVWSQLIDWVYVRAGAMLTPVQVDEGLNELRNKNIERLDSTTF